MRAPHHRHSRRGGALILALIFMGVVTAGFATWITVIRQRARVGDLQEHQARKRIGAASSEVMVRDYMLRRVLASNGDPDGLDATTSGSWNNATATSWDGHIKTGAYNGQNGSTTGWTGYALDSTTRLAGLNAFSPTFDYPYSKRLIFTTNYRRLSYNSEVAQFANDTTVWHGHLRSRNPVLSGDLLVLHRPTAHSMLPVVNGNVAVFGRVVHFTPELHPRSYTARSLRFTSPPAVPGGVPSAITVEPTDISGAALPWDNLTWTPLSTGNVNSNNLETAASGRDWRVPDLIGQLNFIDSPANPSNSLKAELNSGATPITATGSANANDSRGFSLVRTGTSPSGTGIATITPSMGSSTSDLPSVIISDDLTEMIIEGQTGSNLTSYAPYRPCFAVVYTQSATGRNLTTIRLRNQNNRRMILALKRDQRSAWTLPGNTPKVQLIFESTTHTTVDWHMVILSENVPLDILYSNTGGNRVNTVRLFGGIQTNASLIFQGAPNLFEINLETDSRGLVRMTPRLAWVETFLSGKL